jgi:hypothetical protein
MLPQIAQGDANKLWIVPSELGKALEGMGSFFGNARDEERPRRPDDPDQLLPGPGPDGPGSITRLPRP